MEYFGKSISRSAILDVAQLSHKNIKKFTMERSDFANYHQPTNVYPLKCGFCYTHLHWNEIGQCILIKAFQHLQSEMLCFFLAQILQNRVVLPNTTHNLLRSVRVRFLFYSHSLEWELTVYIGKSFSRSTI